LKRCGVKVAQRGVLLCALVLVACGKPAKQAPQPNQTARAPDLSGRTVLLLPVQPGPVPNAAGTTAPGGLLVDGLGALDAEIAYWLQENSPRTKWVMPDALRRTVQRSPTLAIDLNTLDVSAFRRAQVRRIGDPLYGDLRKLAAVHDASLAVVPVAAEFRPTSTDSGHIEIAAALVDVHYGTVYWFGVVAGETGARGAAELAVSAAQKFSRQFATIQRDTTGAIR